MLLTRRYRFSASHRLHSPELSELDNQEIFGKCNNPYGHGHNYEIEITVDGSVDSDTGRLVDLQQLDALVNRHIVNRFDHTNLNQETPEFATLVPTTENLGVVIDRRLRQAWPETFPGRQPRLKTVRIYETARNIFEVGA